MEWKTAWSYLPIDYHTVIGTLENTTQKTCIKNNLNGTKLKLKLSNRYGKHTLMIEKITLGKRRKIEGMLTNVTAVTSFGKERITVEAFEEFYSDEISFPAEAGTWFEISIYIKEKTPITSACATWSAQSFKSVYILDQDQVKDNTDPVQGEAFCGRESREIYPVIEKDVNKATVAVGFDEVCVLTGDQVKTVVLFGDSITHMSYYSDALIERLYSRLPGKITVINRGIGGNRMLHDATYAEEVPGNGWCFGKAAMDRFEEDVCIGLSTDMVILEEGINDIMHPYVFHYPEEAVTQQELAEGMEKVIICAHKYGVKIYIGTLMPFHNGEEDWMEEADVIRREYNQWIRSQTLSDGVVEFDKAVERKEDSSCMIDSYHIGDGLHPGEEGGSVMAEAIPLAWFL